MTLTLYAFPLSPRSFKVLWAAHQLGVDYQFELVDFTKGGQRTPEYLALNPNGKAPVMDHDGYVLWESNAIVEYLASLKPASGAMPQDARSRLNLTKWLYWESAHWDPACAIFAFERVVKSLFKIGAPDPAEIKRGTEKFEAVGAVLDAQLKKHRFIAGDTLTIADLSVGAAMSIAEPAGLPVEAFRGIQRWHAELKALPSWQKTVAMQKPPGS